MGARMKRLLAIAVSLATVISSMNLTGTQVLAAEKGTEIAYEAESVSGEKTVSGENVSEDIVTALDGVEPDGISGDEAFLEAAAGDLSDPEKNSNGNTVWDCVYFGSYPQAEVVADKSAYTAIDSACLKDGDLIEDSGLYSALQSASYDSNDLASVTYEGTTCTYKRIKKSSATYSTTGKSNYYDWPDSETYHYFRCQPIKWRVLSVSGDDALLLADQGLDDQTYNTAFTSITWEDSTVRSWLNGSFLNTAFTTDERNAINTVTVTNSDNPDYGTDGGNNTKDSVFLLSTAEACNSDYGFSTDYSTCDTDRRTGSSTYAKAMGAWRSTSDDYAGNCFWWLRSPGDESYNAEFVKISGDVYREGANVYGILYAIRPALHLNLSSDLWATAGAVCSDGTAGDLVSVSLNAAGGTCSKSEVRIFYGAKYGTLPKPIRRGYVFGGWYTQEQGGTKVLSDSVVQNPESQTLYAHWIANYNDDLSKPRKDASGNYIWDCIYFGNDNSQPIKWRVLSVKGNDAFLLAENCLDSRPYNTVNDNVTWENSSIREWLNKDFMEYFTSEEQGAIITTNVVNGKNPYYGTLGGINTKDKVFLLSISEVCSSAYGFSTDPADHDKARATGDPWWLRSPGNDSINAAYVSYEGDVDRDGNSVSIDGNVIRPALHLNLSSDLWSSAGTVSASGTVSEPVTISLNAAGGTCNAEEVAVYLGQSNLSLPQPYRKGHTFLGWYLTEGTEANSADRITAEKACSLPDGTTLYAHWAEKEDYITLSENDTTSKDESLTGHVNVVLKKSSYTYTGAPICPVPTVTYAYQQADAASNAKPVTRKLVQNTDYVITYENNVSANNAGAPTLHVSGIGDYGGEITKTFTILPKTAKKLTMEPIEDIEVEGMSDEVIEEKCKNAVIVKDGNLVVSPAEYDVTVTIGTDKKGARSAKLAIVMKDDGNYTGAAPKATAVVKLQDTSAGKASLWTVKPAKTLQLTYTGAAQKPKMEVYGSSGTKIPASCYKLIYGNNVNAGTGYVYAVGKNGYTGVSPKTSFAIGKRDPAKIKVSGLAAVTGLEVSEVHPVVKDGKMTLTEGTDYTVSLADTGGMTYGAAGKVTIPVTIRIISPNYESGVRVESLTVMRKSLQNIFYTKVRLGKAVFDGVAGTPSVEVRYKGELLTEGEDYTLQYKSNTKIGKKGSVTITGIGVFCGTVKKSFPVLVEQINVGLYLNGTEFSEVTDPVATMEVYDRTKGKQVNFSIVPITGMHVDSITVLDVSGNTVPYQKNVKTDGKYYVIGTDAVTDLKIYAEVSTYYPKITFIGTGDGCDTLYPDQVCQLEGSTRKSVSRNAAGEYAVDYHSDVLIRFGSTDGKYNVGSVLVNGKPISGKNAASSAPEYRIEDVTKEVTVRYTSAENRFSKRMPIYNSAYTVYNYDLYDADLQSGTPNSNMDCYSTVSIEGLWATTKRFVIVPKDGNAFTLSCSYGQLTQLSDDVTTVFGTGAKLYSYKVPMDTDTFTFTQ